MLRHNPEFGEAVKRVLEAHGVTMRGQRIRTGIDHVTMSDMCSGMIPRLEKVEQFARAFELDVNEWRRLAGYPVVEETDPRRALAQLRKSLKGYVPDDEDLSDARASGAVGNPDDEDTLRAVAEFLRRQDGED